MGQYNMETQATNFQRSRVMNALSFDLKAANMRQAQNFICYKPSNNNKMLVQSEKRVAYIDINTGQGVINAANVNYPNQYHLQANVKPFILTNVKELMQAYESATQSKASDYCTVI